MTIFIYADESGVFDKTHNDYFVFGGLIFLDKQTRDEATRKYLAAERALGGQANRTARGELKASKLSNKQKGKLFRSLNQYTKFAVIVRQRFVFDRIFEHKKTKQRYLDYAFKVGLKKAITTLIQSRDIPQAYSSILDVRMDEHSTATDGKYELREGLEQEYKIGTFSQDYRKWHRPILPCLQGVNFSLCDSAQVPLIRAADIVANRVYALARGNKLNQLNNKVILRMLP